jgi:hypothetical protein
VVAIIIEPFRNAIPNKGERKFDLDGGVGELGGGTKKLGESPAASGGGTTSGGGTASGSRLMVLISLRMRALRLMARSARD